jgi:hypothetical protein
MGKHAKSDWEPESKKSYYDFINAHEICDDEHHIVMSTFDRLDVYHKCGKQIKLEGMTFKSANGVIHRHPLLPEQKTAWSGFLQGLKLLGFSGDDTPKRLPGRPAQGLGCS